MQRACKDHGIRPDMSLTPAERAVKYILEVLPYHPNLAYYLCPGTQMLHLLLAAEAARLQQDYDEKNPLCGFARAYARKLSPEDPLDGLACPHCGQVIKERTGFCRVTSPQEIHENAKAHGWYEGVDAFHALPPEFIPCKLALIHAEISEALEAYRSKGCDTRGASKPGEHGLCEELADAVIRIFDLAGFLGLDIIGMIAAKHKYNLSRPHKHGGKLV